MTDKTAKLTFTEFYFRRAHENAPDQKATSQWVFQSADESNSVTFVDGSEGPDLTGPRFFAWGTLREAKAALAAAGRSGLWAVLP